MVEHRECSGRGYRHWEDGKRHLGRRRAGLRVRQPGKACAVGGKDERVNGEEPDLVATRRGGRRQCENMRREFCFGRSANGHCHRRLQLRSRKRAWEIRRGQGGIAGEHPVAICVNCCRGVNRGRNTHILAFGLSPLRMYSVGTLSSSGATAIIASREISTKGGRARLRGSLTAGFW